MNILIVGNVLKDVYLGLDSRTEAFEADRHHIRWLDFSFDTSEHHFFSRHSTYGGAAVSLEVLQKLGLDASVSNSDFAIQDDEPSSSTPPSTYRYILTSDDNVAYLVPSHLHPTTFTTPSIAPDYIYIDRSAHLTEETAEAIKSYLDANMGTALVLYAGPTTNRHLEGLIPSANLIIAELNRGKSAISRAPISGSQEDRQASKSGNPASRQATEPDNSAIPSALQTVDPEKIVYLSESTITYKNITEPIAVNRIDKLTHLSAFSITAATVLGSFILGKTVEQSLKMARVNVENATLDAVLELEDLEGISAASSSDLSLIAATLTTSGKGILAADESGGSIKKKFAALDIADTAENRHDYRNIFFSTPDIERYVSGIILFDETARDRADNGQSIPDFLVSHRMVPGIKVDQGLAEFGDTMPGATKSETYTKGLEGLPTRLREYYQMGLRFAKWRAAFNLTLDENGKILTPTPVAITENCRILAEYARNCQSAGLVPIVEPEVVYDGDYTITKCAAVTGNILDALFRELDNFGVDLGACILKCNMVLAGKKYHEQSTPDEVGRATAEVLRRHVPSALAGVVFLSGGQTPEQATANLAAVIKNGPFPWPVTFSFARALQDPALYAWAGNNDNTKIAQDAFLERLAANAEALIV